ncbi:SH3 domain-containing protein [Thalassococcus sp. CAU 1522]|uniref:SH3 domain-containing protein n=1 Tax=Thalassococcus arenae TaxID=2851652 RepID=A0ABS6N8W8_9RHOB|nr:SH3 domain-containing protein [Thalassococcus arenae]MBV2360449.1 SH3 domain-containing protein [Thalassococcus arenae]
MRLLTMTATTVLGLLLVLGFAGDDGATTQFAAAPEVVRLESRPGPDATVTRAAQSVLAGSMRMIESAPRANPAPTVVAESAQPALWTVQTGPATARTAVTPDETARFATVTGNRVNLRSGPGIAYDSLGKLHRSDRFRVLYVRDGWAKLDTAASLGDAGWMTVQFLAFDDG